MQQEIIFAQGGESLLVTRVVTGSFTPASSEVPSQNSDGGKLVTLTDALLPSITTNPTDAVDATYTAVDLTSGTGTGAEATIYSKWKYYYKYNSNSSGFKL